MWISSRRLRAIIPFVAMVVVSVAWIPPVHACKGGDPPESIGPDTVAGFETIAIAKIIKVEPLAAEGRYAPPFRMRATVVRPLRGNLRAGDAVEAETSTEEGHAVCPLQLFKEGVTYLVFLRGKGPSYVMPRYHALDVEESDARFGRYVETIATFNRVEAKRSGCGACSVGSSDSDAWQMIAWLAFTASAARRTRRGARIPPERSEL